MLINLVSGPRNVSTALMYSFAQRSDCTVADEPFYAYYLSNHAVNHPGAEQVLASQPKNWEEVVLGFPQNLDKQYLFLKNMAHHLTGNWQGLLDIAKNIFLVRDPAQLIVSFAKVIVAPTLSDIGLKKQYELFSYLKDQNRLPVVLDSGELLANPVQVLKEMCSQLELPFERSMLQWPSGSKPYDGVWAPYWYTRVHQSTGFQAPPSGRQAIPDHLIPLYEEALPYYEALTDFAIKA